MSDLYDKTSENFLELASPQRLEILFKLLQKRSTPTFLAKDIGATKQEVHRNFTRLEDSGLIEKDKDGKYGLTTFGKTMCTQVPSIVFLSQNRKYFEDHTFGNLPTKFIMRAGQLASGKYVKGVSKTLEQWKHVYKNADEYVYEILSEVPLDLIEPLIRRVKQGIRFQYIFDENVVAPKGRKALLKKLGFDKLIEKGMVERKMDKDVRTVLVLNEKEACLMFPRIEGDADITEMLYSDDPMFHEWCLDYFRYCWYGSDVFQESKLKE
jgi:predicted transcriptional regulator